MRVGLVRFARAICPCRPDPSVLTRCARFTVPSRVQQVIPAARGGLKED